MRAAVLATGTYLKGRTIVGDVCRRIPALTGCTPPCPSPTALLKLGLPLRRFKTGTPPRVNARSCGL